MKNSRMFKRVFAICLMLVMLLVTVACGSSGSGGGTNAGSGGAASGEVIKVGHFGPLTGAISLSGQEAEKGARLRVTQINNAGGIDGKKIEFIAYDDKGTPEGAVKAVTRLLDEDKVNIILGSQLSANVQAVGDRIEKAQIPLVGTGVGPVWLQQGWTYLFRSVANSTNGAGPLVDAMDAVNTTRMGVLVYQDEGSRSAATLVLDEIAKRGKIEVTTEEVFQPNDTDWTGQFSKILATDPDGIMLFAQGEHVGPMMMQLRGLGYKGYVYGPETMSLPDIRKIAAADADGIVFFAPHCIPDSVEEANSDKEKAFLEAFVQEYGSMPVSDVAYRTYDAMTVIEAGLRAAEGSLDGTAIRDAIKNQSSLELLAGTADYTAFDNGEGLTSMQIFVTDEGKNKLFDDFIANNPADKYKP